MELPGLAAFSAFVNAAALPLAWPFRWEGSPGCQRWHPMLIGGAEEAGIEG